MKISTVYFTHPRICSDHIQSTAHNLSLYANVISHYYNDKTFHEFTCDAADVIFEDELWLDWKNHVYYLKSTPGHSPGSICIMLDEKYLFTGDSLLADYKVITRFPEGNRRQYQEVSVPYFDSLPKDLWVYPGHGRADVLGKILDR